MNTYESVEEYAASVEKRTSNLLGSLCLRLGPEHPTTIAVMELACEAGRITTHSKLHQDQAGDYDLAALIASVDVSAPSSSENPFEDE